jgi:hypothetical protein
MDYCPNDKVPLVKRPIERQTYEQRWCGTWYDCPAQGCGRSVLYPSAALLEQLEEMRQRASLPTQAALPI